MTARAAMLMVLAGLLLAPRFSLAQEERPCFVPPPPYPGVPEPPACAAEGACDAGAKESYRNDIEDYIKQVERYGDLALTFVDCEIERAVNAWERVEALPD